MAMSTAPAWKSGAPASGSARWSALWGLGMLLVFVGGIGGWYPERRPAGPGDAREQFGDALEMMKANLEKAGTSMANVLRITVSLVDPAKNWDSVADVFRERFPDPKPVCTCFGVTGFRRGPGQLLQVECIASIG